MKKLFSVDVKEVYIRTVEVRAESETEAREIAKNLLEASDLNTESFYAYDLPTEEWTVEELPEPVKELSIISTDRFITPAALAITISKGRTRKE